MRFKTATDATYTLGAVPSAILAALEGQPDEFSVNDLVMAGCDRKAVESALVELAAPAPADDLLPGARALGLHTVFWLGFGRFILAPMARAEHLLRWELTDPALPAPERRKLEAALAEVKKRTEQKTHGLRLVGEKQ